MTCTLHGCQPPNPLRHPAWCKVEQIQKSFRLFEVTRLWTAVEWVISLLTTMRILVTGGAGFIGSHFVEKCLGAGHSVAVLDEFNDFYDPRIKRANLAAVARDVPIHEIDIRDGEAVFRTIKAGKFDAIVHLAARAGVRPSIREPKLYIDTNITGTWHLLEAACQANVPRFICASSSSVYGVLKTAPFREDMCLNQTISPYAATKLAAEQLCSNYSHLYGLRTINLRFFTVYGPRQRPDLAIHSFTKAIWEGRVIRKFGDGSTRRDYTYIDDILQGMSACLTYEGPLCDVFNLGESQTTTLNELIVAIEQTLGKRAQIEQLPEQPGDVPLTFADIGKARAHLGYDPKIKIREGIPKFVEWFHGVPSARN
jgi:UDP-glucuronate 4-epimerase